MGDAHDRLFAAAEAAGEERGSRLGTKLAAPTNYCELDVMTGDELTQRVIKDDEDIADEAARVYHAFVDLVERIQEKRFDDIPEQARKQLEFVWLERVEEAVAAALDLAVSKTDTAEKVVHRA